MFCETWICFLFLSETWFSFCIFTWNVIAWIFLWRWSCRIFRETWKGQKRPITYAWNRFQKRHMGLSTHDHTWAHKGSTKEENVSSNTLFSIQWRDLEDINKGNSFSYFLICLQASLSCGIFICKQILTSRDHCRVTESESRCQCILSGFKKHTWLL